MAQSRNEKCKCGSGKKYKKCCISENIRSVKKIEIPKLSSIQIPRDSLGYPGIPGELLFTVDQPEKPEGISFDHDQSLREFEVGALFSKTGDMLEAHKTVWDETAGGSHLLFPVNRDAVSAQIEFKVRGVRYIFKSNSLHEMSIVTVIIQARNIPEANHIFINNLMPYLDFMSYKSNCPLIIQKRYCKDIKHGMVSVSFSNPYKDVQIPFEEGFVREELFPIFALYREAKNSNSHYYRFFCYCKIMEGVFTSIRPNRMKESRQVGHQSKSVKEVVPNDTELMMFNKDHVGKPIQSLYETVLQKSYRDALAHFTLDDGTPMNVSENRVSAEFANQLLLAELCCRTVVETERKALEDLEEFKSNHPQILKE